MRRVRLAAEGWASEASWASTFGERFRGLRGRADDSRLLFETSSVHTLGMDRSISVVMIDRRLRVVGTRSLVPNRVAFKPAARFILELPLGAELPAIGARVEIFDV